MAKASHHLELVELATFEEGGHQVRYDEAGRQILLLKHHEFTAVPYGPGHDLSAAALPCANNGPVLDVRFAPPPLRWVCIQRAATLLELRQLDGPAVHLHQLRPSGGRSSERILSMHWTGSAFCDLLVLGTWGADMLVLGAGARGPKRVRAVAFGAAWALYSAETRMAALGGGKKDNELCCFQIGSGGVVRVPKFEVELPQPAPAPTDPAPPARSLRRADVRLLCSRGLIFLVHLDGPARQLVPYQLFRDYVLRKPALRLPAARLALSQVDGLLAVHCLPAGSEAPSAAGAGANEPGLEDTAPLGECRTLLLELEPSGRCQPIAPALPIGPRPAVEAAGHAGGERWAHWTLLAPSAVVDHSVGRVYELRLDLRAIAASCGAQPVRLLSLLLGRTGAQPEVSAVLTAALREQRPAATLRALFDLLHAAAGREAAAGGARGALLREAAAEETAGELSGCVAAAGSPASPSLGPERGAAQPAAPSPAASVSSSASSCAACAATPAHASTATASSPLRPRPALAPSPGCCLSARQIGSIFEAVEAEAAEQPSRADGHEGSSAAERAATILEYLRSAAAHGAAVDAPAMCVLVRALASAGRFFQLEQLLQAGALPESVALARELLALGEEAMSSAAEHALDMLRALGAPARPELLALLVQRGELVSACALIQAHGLEAPAEPLQARAEALGDACVLGAVRAFAEARRSRAATGAPALVRPEARMSGGPLLALPGLSSR